MSESTNTESSGRGRKDALTELLRTGARKLITPALEAEVAELFATFAVQQDEQGHAVVVCNGHQPERDIQTSIGIVKVQVPEVEVGRASS